MYKPTQNAWALAIVDFLKRETVFKELDIKDQYNLIQISNALKLVNEWVLELDKRYNQNESSKT